MGLNVLRSCCVHIHVEVCVSAEAGILMCVGGGPRRSLMCTVASGRSTRRGTRAQPLRRACR